LYLLGGFALYVGGHIVSTTPGAERLLAFLALQPRKLGRSYVAGRLWGDVAEKQARHRLRTALWQLRAVDKGVVTSDRSRIGLGPVVAVDVHELIRQAQGLDAGDQSAAAFDPHLYRHDLLPDWYDEWLTPEQAEIRQIRLEALERLAVNNLGKGENSKAVRAALLATGVDPLRESAHLLVVEAYIAEGNRAAALHHFNQYGSLLRRQLGVQPSPEILALIEGIRPPNPGLSTQ